MRPMEFLRAAGLAFVVLIIDVVLAVGVVYVWGRYLHPHQPPSYYETAGIAVARWSTRTLGTALMLLAVWAATHQRPQRPAYRFAVALVFFYALLDAASAGFENFFNLDTAVSTALKLIGACCGAGLGLRQRIAARDATAIR